MNSIEDFKKDSILELKFHVSHDQAYKTKRCALKVVSQSMYVCIGVLKDGFIVGYRLFIGIDGCHLKGPTVGVLLIACAINPNGMIYRLS